MIPVLLQPPEPQPTLAELFNATAGGELGITFFARGVRVFIPQDANRDDKLAAANFLFMLAEAM